MISSDIPPLLAMSNSELEDLYRRSPAGTTPDGTGRGVAILAPRTPLARPAARAVQTLFWQGKVFNREHSELRNSITVFRLLAIKARVYRGPSLLDGMESIVLDYARSSLLAWWVRDEIREVAPGMYLGLAYGFKIRLIWFALVFSPGRHGNQHHESARVRA